VSIEAIYPSRQQSKADNPLFARSLRRRRLAFMALLTVSGIGLLVAQIAPMNARAENPAPQPQAVAEPATPKAEPQPFQDQKAAPKTIRQIQIYNMPVETSAQKDARKS